MANGLRGSADIMKKMMYDPIRQQELARAEGMDKRAISGINQTVGKMVAGEQARLQALDIRGEDLALRKDKLAFSRKISRAKLKHAQRTMPWEIGIGAVSTAIEGANVFVGLQRDRKFAEMQEKYYKGINRYTGETYKNTVVEGKGDWRASR